MNLTAYVARTSLSFKLTKPQMNLLEKLNKMGVEITDYHSLVVVENPTSGFTGLLNPFIATLVKWVYEVYATYGLTGTMNYRGTKVAVGTFDRVRYLILSVDETVFRDFID